MASGIFRSYKDPKTVKKDAMFSVSPWTGFTVKKAKKKALSAWDDLMEEVPKTKGKRVYPKGKGR